MKNLIFLTILIFSLSSYGQDNFSFEIDPPYPALKCSKDGTILLYVNGQDNLQKDSELALANIQEILRDPSMGLNQKIDVTGKVEADYSFNPTQGKLNNFAIADFVESASLILQTEYGFSRSQAWLLSFGVFGLGVYSNVILNLIAEGEPVSQLDDKFLEVLRNPISELLESEIQATHFLKHKIKEAVYYRGKKLILISHSQGNLFVNKAYDELIGTEDLIDDKIFRFNDFLKVIGNAQVATPARSISNSRSNYITNDADSINWIVTGLSPNFPQDGSKFTGPNAKEYPDFDHHLNHSFVYAYLFGEGSAHSVGLTRQTIQNWVEVASMLESNCGEPPVASFKYEEDLLSPLTLHFMSEVSDPDEDEIKKEQFKYFWHFNGKSDSEGLLAALPGPWNPTFSYKEPGEYFVTLIVEDQDGNRSKPFVQKVQIKNSDQGCGGASGVRTKNQFNDYFIADTATVGPLASIAGTGVEICGDAWILDGAAIYGDMGGTLKIGDGAIIGTGSRISNSSGDLVINGNAIIENNVTFWANGNVSGDSHIKSNVYVSLDAPARIVIKDRARLEENSMISGHSGEFMIEGDSRLLMNARIGTGLLRENSQVLHLSGQSKLGGVVVMHSQPFLEMEGTSEAHGRIEIGSSIKLSGSTVIYALPGVYGSGLVASVEENSTSECHIEITNSSISGTVRCAALKNSKSTISISESEITSSGYISSWGYSENGYKASVTIDKSIVTNLAVASSEERSASIVLRGPLISCIPIRSYDKSIILSTTPADCL